MENNISANASNLSCHISESQKSGLPEQNKDTTKQILLKTNINCQACVAKVAPDLNKAVGEGAWSVDTSRPDKLLTVYNDEKSPEEIRNIISAAGYKAETLNNSF